MLVLRHAKAYRTCLKTWRNKFKLITKCKETSNLWNSTSYQKTKRAIMVKLIKETQTTQLKR